MSLRLYCEDDNDEEDLCCSPCCVNYQPTCQNPRRAPKCKWLRQVNEDNGCQSCCCQDNFDCYDDCRNCLISCYPPKPPRYTWKCCPVEPPCWRHLSEPSQPMCCKPTVCCKKIATCIKPSICSVVCKQSDTGTCCDSLKGVVAVLVLMIVIILSVFINSKLPIHRKTSCCIANLFK